MLFLIPAAIATPPTDSLLNHADRAWAIEPSVEAGFVAPLAHRIRLGQDGTDFDYRAEGGQDNLFFVPRLAADVRLGERHVVTFLYQPLDLRTSVSAQRGLTFDGVDFVVGTPLELRYGFDYYRASWHREVARGDRGALALGAGLQLRNATIDVSSADGVLRTTNRDIGPVPLLQARGEFAVRDSGWAGFDVAGMYAPIKYINGSNTDVVGAILDASVRVGVHANRGIDPFLSLRYIGGGAAGTESSPDPGKDGYVENWLSFANVSLGVRVR